MQLFVNNLTNIDFSYLCPDRGLVGETWLVNIVLKGPIDPQGMVCDFGKVKKTLRTWLDATLTTAFSFRITLKPFKVT
jgi:hypothetical protein